MPTMEDYAQMLEGVQEPLRSIALQIIEASNGAIGISSGFRTYDQQAQLYDDYINGRNGQARAARPGHSKHERGMAIDFSGDMELLAELAPKFGLFQPMDDEAWHWELGDGQSYEGGGMLGGFEATDTDPMDSLANRMNAIFSILGGNNGGDVMSPMDQNGLWSVTDEAMAEQLGMAGAKGAADALTGAGAAIGEGSVGQYQKYALKRMVQQYGLDESELPALIELWNRESNWNPNADNPTSSASGIAQKMTSIHGPVEGTWQGQIDWGLDYIMGRYGSPSAALQWHNQHNWY